MHTKKCIGISMRKIIFLATFFVAVAGSLFCKAQSGNIYTFAGNGTAGFAGDGGLATAAELNGPTDVFKDAAGNTYIADRNNNRVRKVNPAGIISTIAGTGVAGYTGDGGLATAARLRHPNGVCVDAAGNIYIADESNNVIRMINAAGIITTIAGTGVAGFSGDGGPATSAKFNDPQAVAKDLAGNIYVADNNNSRVRIINTAGVISTFAGGGAVGFTVDGVSAISVSLCNVHDVSVDNSGNVYFTNQGCWHFLRVTGGLIYDEAGAAGASYTGDCGPADSADIQSPYGIYPDNIGNVYLCPRGNIRVRKVNTFNYITTVVGTGIAGYTGDGGPALNATVSTTIYGVYADPTGNIYFADAGNNVIRNFTSSNYSDTVTIPICAGGTDTLHDTVGHGTWISSNTSVAIVGSSSGVVTGVTGGTSIITYSNSACPALFLVAISEPIIAGGAICVGSTLTLTDTVVGVWTSGATGIATVGASSGIVTGVSAGTVIITHTAGDCYGIATVTVNLQPAVITGTNVICQGTTTALTDATTGGVWTSSNIIVATVGTDGTVTGSTAGTSTISYTIGSCSATLVVTVNTAPVAITGNSPVCQTFSITLSDVVSGGVWSSVTPAVGTVSTTGVVTGIGVGTTVVSYAIGSCYVTTIVTVNTQPAIITGIASLCQGTTTALTDATGSGVWSSSNTTVAGVGTDGTVTTGIAGTSTITYAIGSCYVTDVVTVNTQPAAITGNTSAICQTFSISLTDATGGGIWSSATPAVGTVSTTGVVTGIGVGTTVVSYAIGSCYVTTVVTVNTQPAAITGIASLCQGTTTALTDATGSGVWSSSNTAVAGVGTDGTVTTGIAGTSTITYAIGSCYVTDVVTVNTQPAAITGNTSSICQTFSISLTDVTGGGVWSSATLAVGTVSATGVVTGIGVGTTVVSYTIGSCYVTTIVTVNTQPVAITGTLSVCKGFTTTLTDATGGGAWTSGNGAVASVVGGVVTGNLAGTATITYTIGSCYSTVVVTVNTQPVNITGNTTPVCQTFSINLSDATGGGTWSSVTPVVGTVSVTGVVTGIGVGTTVISYTIGACAATTIVTVVTQPAAISGTLAVCLGLTTSLSDATGGGVWSSTLVTTASITAGGIVTGNGTGTTTISYTLGICAATAIVTVNPLPAAITGTKTVCSGFTSNLFDTPGGGTWSSSNTAVATAGLTTGVITGQVVAVTSTATITYTLGTGCIMTTVVTVNPLPAAISGANAVCLGSTISLSDATGGGTWSSANGGIASVGLTTGIVTGNTVGVTTISYTLPTGCYSTIPMTVNPLPAGITGPTAVCPFATITLSDATGGGTWGSSNTGIATVGLTTGVVTGVTAGTVSIIYTLGTGCDAGYTITVNPAPVPVITPVGDTIFCPGGFVALTANTGAGLNYQWYIGGAAIGGALSSSYIVTIAGSYQVFETNSFGCSTLSIPMSVSIDTAVAAITAGSSTTVCSGTSVTLSANIGAGFSYQWLMGGVPITGAVGSTYTTTTAGDYSVIVTNATGCQATSNVITISTNPSPTANIVLSGPLTFCQGDSVVMTTDYASDYGYQWYNAAGMIVGADGLSYTATTAGGYYVIVTNSYGCTATSVVSTVVVNPLPDVTITASGATLFCAGGSVTLSATAVAGDTYQWYVGGSAIAGATNSSYLVTVGGGYQVQVTDPATGCTAKTLADTVVTVVGTPVIVPITPASFCWGGSALLSTSITGATGTVIYQWYLNGVLIPGATGATYNASIAGNYSCQITIPGSCTVTTLAAPVTEYPLPNPLVTFDGTYFRTGSYFVTYQWYMNLVAITGATDSFTVSIGSGDYKVAVTDTNGCQSYSDVYVYTGGATTSVSNVNKDELSVFPNPTTNELTIKMPQNAYASFTITNSIGQEMISEPLVLIKTLVNVNALTPGVYYIIFRGDNGTKVEKFVKE